MFGSVSFSSCSEEAITRPCEGRAPGAIPGRRTNFRPVGKRQSAALRTRNSVGAIPTGPAIILRVADVAWQRGEDVA